MASRIASAGPKVWLAYAALGVVWGSTWLAADRMADQVPPLLGAAARFSLSSLLLTPVIVLKRLRLPGRRALRFTLLLSFTMIVLPWLLLIWARQNLPSATVTVIFAVMPLVVVLLTPVFEEGDVPRRAMQVAIVGLGAIGVLTQAVFSISQAGAAAVVLVAVASTGVSSLIARREFREVNPLFTAAIVLGAAACQLFLLSMVFERGRPTQWNQDAILSLMFLAFVGGAPAYAGYFWLLQRLRAYQAVTVQWIEAIVAILESALILRVGLSVSMVAGSLVTLVSSVVVLRVRAEDDNTVSLLPD